MTLTARELRADIAIVARASVEDSEKKLRRAGADRVISPYKASGTEMARLALHPQVSGATDVAPQYRMEEIEVAGCAGAGRNDRRGARRLVHRRRPPRRRLLPAEAGGRDDARRRRRRHGARDAEHARPARGAVRDRPRPRTWRAARPRRDAPGRPAGRRAGRGRVHSRRRERHRLSAHAASGRASRSSATTRRTPPCCWRRCSGQPPRAIAERLAETLAERLGDRLDRAEVAGPGLPQPVPGRRLVPRRAARRAGRRRRLRAGASRRRASGSWSSSCRPTRPAR